MEKKVYVVNFVDHDFSPARRFGELTFLSHGKLDRLDTSTMLPQLLEGLKNSHSEDYLMMAGLPLMVAIASAILAIKHGKVNFLLYLSGSKDYVERVVDFNIPEEVGDGT